jgi:hypothetical protein
VIPEKTNEFASIVSLKKMFERDASTIPEFYTKC